MNAGPLHYIREYAGFGEPIRNSEGAWGLTFWEMAEDGFVLVPLVESDAEFHEFFKYHIKSPNYYEPIDGIFLPPDRISSQWRAILLYHEIGHYVFHHQNIHRDKEMGHWIEEYEIYAKEAQLVRNIYGAPYAKLVRKLSKIYEAELAAGTLEIEDEKTISRQELQEIFGSAQSALEKGIQRGITIIDALYRALDRIHKDGNKTEHYHITKWFCDAAKEQAQS